jgi:hypothetical protein
MGQTCGTYIRQGALTIIYVEYLAAKRLLHGRRCEDNIKIDFKGIASELNLSSSKCSRLLL